MAQFISVRYAAAAQTARAFSLKVRLNAVDATDLGSKGAYGIGVLSRKKFAKFSQKACSYLVSQAKR